MSSTRSVVTVSSSAMLIGYRIVKSRQEMSEPEVLTKRKKQSAQVDTGGGAGVAIVFAPAYESIRRSKRPSREKADLTAEVQEIEAAIAAPQVDESWLARRLRALKKMAPDIAEVALAGLSGLAAVVSETVKKIAARVKEEK